MEHALDPRQMEHLLPFFAVMFGIVGVALPAICFSMVRKIAAENESLAGVVAIGATLVCITGMCVAGVLSLALIGWLPTPAELLAM